MRIKTIFVALVAALSNIVVAGTASATHVTCGMTVTSSITFDANVTGCSQGLVVGAPNIKIDLNGYSLEAVAGSPGEGAGIRTNGFGGVRITDGTIKYFDAGVVIEGVIVETGAPETIDAAIIIGGGSRVDHITAEDNIGTGTTDFGDGILVRDSSFNRVDHNTVIHNGPFDGIGTLGPATNNEIDHNTVTNNNIDQLPTLNQDDGIRLEPQAVGNDVHHNTVTGSGLDGIAVFNPTGTNTVRSNTVSNNGGHTHAHRKGDGIRIFSPAAGTNVELNTICGNAANGIIVDNGGGAGVNFITDNNVGVGTLGCNANNTSGALDAFDLHDANMTDPVVIPPTPPGVPCLTNVWTGNYTAGDTFNHNCTTNP